MDPAKAKKSCKGSTMVDNSDLQNLNEHNAPPLSPTDYEFIGSLMACEDLDFDDHQACSDMIKTVRDLKRDGWTFSRNSDGERSEHRADNA